MVWRGRIVLMEKWKVSTLIVACSAVAWVGAFMIHSSFLPFVSHSPGIDLVFIPSGVRLLVIMIGGIWAAVGFPSARCFSPGPNFRPCRL